MVDGEPIIKNGVEIELENETPEILTKLDGLFLTLTRDGAVSIMDEIIALKNRIKQVEDKLKGAQDGMAEV